MRRATFYPRASVRGFQFGVLLAFLALLALAIAAAPANGQTQQPYAVEADLAIDYIRSKQNTDGGFPAFGDESSPGSTVDAIFAFVADDRDPADVVNGGNSPLDYLETQASGVLTDPGAASKLAFGLAVSGVDASDFAGLDLYEAMEGFYNDSTGVYGDDVWDEAFFILALSSSGQNVPAAAIGYLKSLQQPDGGWEFGSGFGTDTNTTALMVQSLVAGDVADNDAIYQDALDYLHATQNDDGGWGYDAFSDSEPSSTGFVIQALLSAGENINDDGSWVKNGTTPLEALISHQNPDTGAFIYFGEDNIYATYQAIPAIVLAPFDTFEPSFAPTPPPSEATASPTATPAQFPSTGGAPADSHPFSILALVILGAGVVAGGAFAGASLRRR